MSSCTSIRSQFSEYLDGAISGTDMHRIATHLQTCTECAGEFSRWRSLQTILSSLGTAKVPADLGLRLRVAVSQERARTARRRLDAWQMYWQNSLGPLLARGAAGLASAVILLSALALMVGTVAAPPPVAANETTADSTSTPVFLYRVGDADSRMNFRSPLTVEAEISNSGRVYDYRILSGPQTPEVRRQLDNFLLMSHFSPALFYGIPVASRAVLSFSYPMAHRG